MAHTIVGTDRDHTNEIRRLATLLEISQALSGVLNLKGALHSVLDLLERRHQVAGAAVLLIDAESKELHVDASAGVRLPGRRRHRPGEGITGRVLDTGKAVVVPRVSDEPALAVASADRSRPDRRELTYIAVPIQVAGGPRARWRWCSPSKPAVIISARSSSTASSPR